MPAQVQAAMAGRRYKIPQSRRPEEEVTSDPGGARADEDTEGMHATSRTRSAPEALTPAARPVTGAADDYDALIDLVGTRRFVLDRRGVARHARVLPGAGSDHPAADRRARLHCGRGGGRLAGCVPGQSVCDGSLGRWRRRDRAGRLPPLPRLDVAQPRRRAVRRVAACPERRAPRIRRPRPGSTGSISTACALRSRRSSPISIASTLPRPGGPATGTPASIMSVRRGSGVRVRARVPGRDPVRERGRRAARGAAQTGRCVPAARRLDRRGRTVLRRARTRASSATRGVLPTDVPGRGLVVEPARPAHGRHARTRSSSISIASWVARRSSCGSTTHMSATRGPPPWKPAAS